MLVLSSFSWLVIIEHQRTYVHRWRQMISAKVKLLFISPPLTPLPPPLILPQRQPQFSPLSSFRLGSSPSLPLSLVLPPSSLSLSPSTSVRQAFQSKFSSKGLVLAIDVYCSSYLQRLRLWMSVIKNRKKCVFLEKLNFFFLHEV